MAMRPCARTGVQVQSTGGGSGLPKLLARWTVGGEEGRGQRGVGGGRRPSSVSPLPTSSLPLASSGPGAMLWRHTSCRFSILRTHTLRSRTISQAPLMCLEL